MITEESLQRKAGDEAFQEGQQLYRRALVREARRSREECVYTVSGPEQHTVRMTAGSVKCDCGARFCCHSVAALLSAMESGVIREMENYRAQLAAPALFEAVSGMLPQSDGITLLPALFLTKDGLRIGLKIGEDRLYVVRHIPAFLKCREDGTPLAFGKGFEYRPRWMRFNESQERLLDILAECLEGTDDRPLTGAEARLMLLPPRAAARVLEALRPMNFLLQINGEQYTLNGMEEGLMPLNFHLSGTPHRLHIAASLPAPLFPLTKDCHFMLAGDAASCRPSSSSSCARC